MPSFHYLKMMKMKTNSWEFIVITQNTETQKIQETLQKLKSTKP